MTRRSTSTSTFGVSRRESHDAPAFYRRFSPPALSSDSSVAAFRALDKLIAGDARHMAEVPGSSVALVVTSPPHSAGKEYEEPLGENGIPGTCLEYLELLREVFAECVRKLEPGGRIAVSVANLGRRPYRSLSADVIGTIQDDLRLPPVLSTTREAFMENTLDVREVPAESATGVGHPAPFPVELPARGSAGAHALRELTGPNKRVRAAVEILERRGLESLRALCAGRNPA
jgi:DNA modification methylase